MRQPSSPSGQETMNLTQEEGGRGTKPQGNPLTEKKTGFGREERFAESESHLGTEQEVASQWLRDESSRGGVTGQRDWGVAWGRGSWDPRGRPGAWEQGGMLGTPRSGPGPAEWAT